MHDVKCLVCKVTPTEWNFSGHSKENSGSQDHNSPENQRCLVFCLSAGTQATRGGFRDRGERLSFKTGKTLAMLQLSLQNPATCIYYISISKQRVCSKSEFLEGPSIYPCSTIWHKSMSLIQRLCATHPCGVSKKKNKLRIKIYTQCISVIWQQKTSSTPRHHLLEVCGKQRDIRHRTAS